MSTVAGKRIDVRETMCQVGAMTLGGVGARRFAADEDSLSFTISRGHRRVRVWLAPSDTYTVTTTMIRSGREVFRQEDVNCDQLSEAVWQSHLER